MLDCKALYNTLRDFIPSAKRRSKSKLLSDFVVGKPSWIRTLKQKYHHIDEILQMLDSQIILDSCKAGERVQKKNCNPRPKFSKL